MYGENTDQNLIRELVDALKKSNKRAEEREKAVSLVPEDVRQFVKAEVERLKKVLFEKERIGPPLSTWLILDALLT